jgi:beta-adrenergic-receptor kinase
MYKDFAIVISERWQQEIVETVFETVNVETDKVESKRKSKMKATFYDDEKGSDLILQGQLKKNTGTFGLSWQTRYAKLYPNRLELYYENKEKDPEVYTMERIESIESKEVKGQKTISIFLRNGNEPRIVLSPQVKIKTFFSIYLYVWCFYFIAILFLVFVVCCHVLLVYFDDFFI